MYSYAYHKEMLIKNVRSRGGVQGRFFRCGR